VRGEVVRRGLGTGGLDGGCNGMGMSSKRYRLGIVNRTGVGTRLRRDLGFGKTP